MSGGSVDGVGYQLSEIVRFAWSKTSYCGDAGQTTTTTTKREDSAIQPVIWQRLSFAICDKPGKPDLWMYGQSPPPPHQSVTSPQRSSPTHLSSTSSFVVPYLKYLWVKISKYLSARQRGSATA